LLGDNFDDLVHTRPCVAGGVERELFRCSDQHSPAVVGDDGAHPAFAQFDSQGLTGAHSTVVGTGAEWVVAEGFLLCRSGPFLVRMCQDDGRAEVGDEQVRHGDRMTFKYAPLI
jgi:hypothetical protein